MDATDLEAWEAIKRSVQGHAACDAKMKAMEKTIEDLKATNASLEALLRDNPPDPVARGQATRERPRHG